MLSGIKLCSDEGKAEEETKAELRAIKSALQTQIAVQCLETRDDGTVYVTLGHNESPVWFGTCMGEALGKTGWMILGIHSNRPATMTLKKIGLN